jgi:hypothetical protein
MLELVMKCEVCLERLEEFLDDELPAEDREQIGAHLIACADCSSMFATLTMEQDLFARYDREVDVPPFLWTRVAEHTVYENDKPKLRWYEHLPQMFTPSGALASAITVFVITVALAFTHWMILSLPKEFVPPDRRASNGPEKPINDEAVPEVKRSPEREIVVSNKKPGPRPKPAGAVKTTNESDVISSDLNYLDLDDRDTVNHVEQSQLLLRSIRNFPLSEGDEAIDVSYDKELSRRLLNENIVLRRDAEMKAKFPTKSLLTDLEPFLIDIANLPDQARPEDVRVIKERVQRTEIVAALLDYQNRARTFINED